MTSPDETSPDETSPDETSPDETSPDETISTDAASPGGYSEALAELESILRELEGSDVDVDRLADRVARAALLISFCRNRIGGARLQIDEVLADLDAAAPSGDATPPDPT